MKRMNSKEIGLRIVQLRHTRNITQDELAEGINVCKRTINRWEQGNSTFTDKKIKVVANFFGVTANYIVHGEEENDQGLYLGDEPLTESELNFLQGILQAHRKAKSSRSNY